MSVLREEMVGIHESVTAATHVIEDGTTNYLLDDPRYKAKSKVI